MIHPTKHHKHTGMTPVTPLVLLPAAIGLTVAVLLLRWNWNWRISSKLPPGSMGFPLIGETFSLMKACAVTSIGDFMEQRLSRYGKIFCSNLLGTPTVVSADAELNRFVLKNDLKSFAPARVAARDTVLGRFSISLVVGDTHKKLRSTVMEFLSWGRTRTSFLEDDDRLASLVLSSWNEDSIISANVEASKFTLYATAKKIASINPEDVRMEKLRRDCNLYMKGFASLPIYIPGTTYWKALKARENILNMFNKEMEKRRDNEEVVDDFMGWVMQQSDYSKEQMGDLLLGVLTAGYDTTSKALSSMIHFIEGCPRALQELRDEHLRVARGKQERGETKLTWDDYKNMEFTKCVVNETLRLTNIAAFILKRALDNVEFNGYVIPKGWNVIVHFTAVHLDPANYGDPQSFNPWRWQGSSTAKMTNNLMPFGGGVRLCPGAELARLEMAVFLHHLVLKYEWNSVENDPPVRTPFTVFKKGLPIRVRAANIC